MPMFIDFLHFFCRATINFNRRAYIYIRQNFLRKVLSVDQNFLILKIVFRDGNSINYIERFHGTNRA